MVLIEYQQLRRRQPLDLYTICASQTDAFTL